ncbi:MAG: hypothetical protein AMJ73_08015 [candidate division Zixibacteria bacterium SM1_73]|nr:MAG: hypothetical protein AMJ73_08015 [candidate division Zixibacteria bacterium SM1_73]
MKKAIILLAIFSLAGFSGGCDKETKVSLDISEEVSKKEATICPEHGVLEDECIRCNPSLIPEFKQKGDWCKEHNLPESQCDICNPALAGKVLLSPESQSLAGIKTEKVEITSLAKKMLATGKITFNQKKLSHITSRVSGRTEKVFAFLQSKVEAGQPLVSLYSPEYLTAQSEYIQAEERLKRTKQVSSSEEKSAAEAICESAKQRLIILGVPEKEIAELEKTHIVQPYLTVRAPFSGTIVESNVIQGNYVQPGSNLYKLANLSTLWAIADVYEKDIAVIKIGQVAEITTSAYPHEAFKGKVSVIGDVLDEKTRTFKVRIEVPNPKGKLKPEMFARISIITGNDSVVAVTKETILVDGDHKIVFVSSGDNTYNRREVDLGREADGLVEVVLGLKKGENVVTEGNFLLKSELLKSKLGAGCAE